LCIVFSCLVIIPRSEIDAILFGKMSQWIKFRANLWASTKSDASCPAMTTEESSDTNCPCEPPSPPSPKDTFFDCPCEKPEETRTDGKNVNDVAASSKKTKAAISKKGIEREEDDKKKSFFSDKGSTGEKLSDKLKEVFGGGISYDRSNTNCPEDHYEKVHKACSEVSGVHGSGWLSQQSQVASSMVRREEGKVCKIHFNFFKSDVRRPKESFFKKYFCGN